MSGSPPTPLMIFCKKSGDLEFQEPIVNMACCMHVLSVCCLACLQAPRYIHVCCLMQVTHLSVILFARSAPHCTAAIGMENG